MSSLSSSETKCQLNECTQHPCQCLPLQTNEMGDTHVYFIKSMAPTARSEPTELQNLLWNPAAESNSDRILKNRPTSTKYMYSAYSGNWPWTGYRTERGFAAMATYEDWRLVVKGQTDGCVTDPVTLNMALHRNTQTHTSVSSQCQHHTNKS